MKTRTLKKIHLLLGALAAAGLSSVPAFAALEVFEVGGMGKGLRDSADARVQPVPPVYSEIIPPGVPGAPWLLKHGGTSTIREARYGYVSADGKVFITKPEFSAAEPFNYSPRRNACAAVCKNGAWNYIDENGVLVFTSWRDDRRTLRADMDLADFYLSFRKRNAAVDAKESQSAYVRNYAARALAHFVLRGGFEGKADYTVRINSGTIEYESRRRAAEARDAYLARHTPKTLSAAEFALSGMDFDTGTAQLSHPTWGEFRVKAGTGAQGERFDKAFRAGKAKIEAPNFDVSADIFTLKQFNLVVDGRAHPVDNTLPFAANGGTAESDAEIARLVAAVAKSNAGAQLAGRSSVVGTRSVSDVDMDVPKLPPRADGKKRFALVISNEKYDESMGMKDVPFARRDGQVVAQYFRDVLGVTVTEKTNLSSGLFGDALNNFRNQLAANPGAEGYIYYAGHAVAGEDGVARLLPTDVNTELATDYGVNVAEYYKALGETDASRIVVFFDSCYSGGKKDDGSRGVGLAPAETRPAPNMVVLSASTAKQISQPYAEGSHGLFTYFLLMKLKETKGSVSVKELFRYVKENVERVSADKERYRLQTQTPTLLTGSKMSGAELNRALR